VADFQFHGHLSEVEAQGPLLAINEYHVTVKSWFCGNTSVAVCKSGTSALT